MNNETVRIYRAKIANLKEQIAVETDNEKIERMQAAINAYKGYLRALGEEE